ncbi:MAG TPA: hypothetical protein DEA22_02645, partial [Blastocatellia bacterium]|nr:hypothetical protein [Blastocatellia bacterium]
MTEAEAACLYFRPDSCYSFYFGQYDMNIISISIPTPFYVGDVNVFLIKEDPVTLIDVGPKTREAAEALREKLARNGIRFSDIR